MLMEKMTLKQLRVRTGYTKGDVARIMRCSTQNVSRIERSHNPSADAVRSYSSALGYDYTVALKYPYGEFELAYPEPKEKK